MNNETKDRREQRRLQMKMQQSTGVQLAIYHLSAAIKDPSISDACRKHVRAALIALLEKPEGGAEPSGHGIGKPT